MKKIYRKHCNGCKHNIPFRFCDAAWGSCVLHNRKEVKE